VGASERTAILKKAKGKGYFSSWGETEKKRQREDVDDNIPKRGAC